MFSWVNKVVLCSDLPSYTDSNNEVTPDMMNNNINLWTLLESAWELTEQNFTGCGYKWQNYSINAVRFNDGCTGCTNSQ